MLGIGNVLLCELVFPVCRAGNVRELSIIEVSVQRFGVHGREPCGAVMNTIPNYISNIGKYIKST